MEKKNSYKAWIYLAPTLILLAVFTLYPIINTFVISFMDNYSYISGSFDGFTLDNYGVILGLESFPDTMPGAGQTLAFTQFALPNTLIIAFVTVPISVIISLLIAVWLNSIKLFRSFFQTLFFLPYVTNIIAVGMVFSVIFAPSGLFNSILGIEGTNWVNIGPDLNYANAMTALCIEIIWYECPYKILIFASGLQGINKQYYEAARMDSTPKYKVLTNVTIPLLSPQIMYITVTSFIDAFKEYQAVVGLFGDRGTQAGSFNLYTCAYYIYDMVSSGNPHTIQYACAAAVILFLIILVFTLIQLYVGKKRVHY